MSHPKNWRKDESRSLSPARNRSSGNFNWSRVQFPPDDARNKRKRESWPSDNEVNNKKKFPATSHYQKISKENHHLNQANDELKYQYKSQNDECSNQHMVNGHRQFRNSELDSLDNFKRRFSEQRQTSNSKSADSKKSSFSCYHSKSLWDVQVKASRDEVCLNDNNPSTLEREYEFRNLSPNEGYKNLDQVFNLNPSSRDNAYQSHDHTYVSRPLSQKRGYKYQNHAFNECEYEDQAFNSRPSSEESESQYRNKSLNSQNRYQHCKQCNDTRPQLQVQKFKFGNRSPNQELPNFNAINFRDQFRPDRIHNNNNYYYRDKKSRCTNRTTNFSTNNVLEQTCSNSSLDRFKKKNQFPLKRPYSDSFQTNRDSLKLLHKIRKLSDKIKLNFEAQKKSNKHEKTVEQNEISTETQQQSQVIRDKEKILNNIFPIILIEKPIFLREVQRKFDKKDFHGDKNILNESEHDAEKNKLNSQVVQVQVNRPLQIQEHSSSNIRALPQKNEFKIDKNDEAIQVQIDRPVQNQKLSYSNIITESKKKEIKIDKNDKAIQVQIDRAVQNQKLSSSNILTESQKKEFKINKNYYETRDLILKLKSILSLLNKEWRNENSVTVISELFQPINLNNAIFCIEETNLAPKFSICSVRYMQFSKTEINTKIKLNSLLESSSPFRIKNFYDTYFKWMNRAPSLDDSIKKISIYTNLEIDVDDFRESNIPVNKLFDNSFKLKVCKETKLFQNLLTNTSLLPALVNTIVACRDKSKNLKSSDCTLLQNYSNALIQEKVIEIIDKTEITYKLGMFHTDFIKDKNLSKSAKKLRNYLTEILTEPISESIKFKLPNKFGEEFLIDKNPIINRLEIVATKLVKAVKSSLESPKEIIAIRRNQHFLKDLQKIAYHVLKRSDAKKNEVVFAENFLDKTHSLPGNLDQLREIMEVKLKIEKLSLSDLQKCRLKIINFFYKESGNVEEKLPFFDNEKSIKDFFGKLEFVFSTEIETVVEDCQIFQPERTEIEKKDLNSENEKTSLNNYKNIYQELKKKYKLNKFSVNFRNEIVNKFATDLKLDKNNRIIFIEADSLKFSKIKLFQCLQNIPKFKNSNLFVKFELCSNLNDIFDLISSKTINILVIECTPQVKPVDICCHLKSIIQFSVNVKLIIIGYVKKIFEEFKTDCEKINDKFEGSNDLTQDTAVRLFNRIHIFLHNRQLKFNQIIDLKTFQELIKPPKSLSQLIEGKYCLNINNNSSTDFLEGCYIEKKLIRRITISDDIFREKNIDDIFIIKHIVADCLNKFILENENIYEVDDLNDHFNIKGRFFLLHSTTRDQCFDKLLKICQKNVHVLEYDYETMKFIWVQTFGSLAQLYKYNIDESSCLQKFVIESNTFFNDNSHEPIVIISADSGSGKSSFIFNLEKKMYDNLSLSIDKPHWSVRINLKNIYFHCKLKIVLEDIYDAISFLVDLLGYDGLRKELFLLSAIGKTDIRLVLFFDDFEELDDEYSSIVLKLLRILKISSVKKIFITTTPNKKKMLEMEFHTFSYALESFSEDDKSLFLNKYWSQSQKIDDKEKYFSEYIKYFLKFYSSSELDLTSTPLYLKMLAKINEKYLQLLPNRHEIAEISNYYDFFENTCSEIQSSILTSDKMLKIQNLSLKCLMDKLDYPTLVTKNYLKDVSTTKIQYIRHNMFAEFFAAKSLKQKSFSTQQVCSYIDKIIPNTSSFFNHCIISLFELDKPENFTTFINILATKGYINFLDFLLKYKKDEYYLQRALLNLAIENDDLISARMLFDRIIHPEKFDEYDVNNSYECIENILHAAVRCGHLKSLEYFIQKYSEGCEHFFKNCLRQNQIENIDFLFDYFIKTTDKTNGDQILHYAVCLDLNPKTLNFLISNYDINCKNKNQENPLCIAIKKGVNLNTIKYLISKGANLNAQDKSGLLAWTYAIIEDLNNYNKNDQLKIMEYFLKESNIQIKLPEHKNIVSEKKTWWLEVLKKFEYFQHIDSFNLNINPETGIPRLKTLITSDERVDKIWARFLINYGADVNIKISQEKSILHLAIKSKKYELAKTLLRFGTVFNSVDQNGKTPLKLLENNPHNTSSYNQLLNLLKMANNLFKEENLEKFLKNYLPTPKSEPHAQVMRNLLNCRNNMGYTLLHIAALTNNVTLINYLLNFSSQSSKNYINFPKLLVDARDCNNNTPLHLAALMGHEDVIKFLMSANACFDAKNLYGKTPIDFAKSKNHRSVIELLNSANEVFQVLISNGKIEKLKYCVEKYPCIVNSKINCSGRTPVHYAAISQNQEAIDAILINRVKVNVPDVYKKIPLHYAVEKNNIGNLKQLMKNSVIDFRDQKNKRPFDIIDKNESSKILQAISELFEDIQSDKPQIFVENCYEKLMEYLDNKIFERIDKSTIINAKDSKRNHLLYYAVKYDYFDAAVSLLKNGAVYNTYNVSGIKLINIARSTKKLLETIDSIFQTDIDVADLAKINIDHDIISNCKIIKDSKTFSLMEYALEKDKSNVINWLESFDHI